MEEDFKKMSRMFQSLKLFVLGFVFLTAESQTGHILPPQNFSIEWVHDFEPRLTWVPQQTSELNCKYQVCSKTNEKYSELKTDVHSPIWQKELSMEGGFLHFSVITVCNDTKSIAVEHKITYPEMVKNFQCYMVSSEHAVSSWDSASPTKDLNFFYGLVADDSSRGHDSHPPPLQECSAYRITEGIRTGCEMEVKFNQRIYILFNGTVNNTFFRNTFQKILRNDVRPPPLKLIVHKTGSKININWTPLVIGSLEWKYTINYTECNEMKYKTISEGASAQLDVIPHCSYRIAIQAQAKDYSTPWSDDKYVDAEADPFALVYAAVIIPLMFACLAALTIVCCRRNKEHIFPKVPEPRDLLSDISDNNNKRTVYDLYIPVEKEESCEITLVRNLKPSTPDH